MGVAGEERVERKRVDPAAAPVVVGRFDDPAERTADALGERMLGTGPTVRRAPAAGGGTYGAAGGPLQPEHAAGIAADGDGRALDGGLARSMGSRIGQSLTGVRVHDSSRADVLNRSLSSNAFTLGNHVFFRQGAYQPDTAEGQRLIAHEVAHTTQDQSVIRRDPTTTTAPTTPPPNRPPPPPPRGSRPPKGPPPTPPVLDVAIQGLQTAIEGVITGIGSATSQINVEQVDRFSNLIASELKESKIVLAQLPTMAGFAENKGILGNKRAKYQKANRSLDAQRFARDADASMAKAETTKLATMTGNMANLSESEEFQRQTIENRLEKRSTDKFKEYTPEKAAKDPKKFVGKTPETAPDGKQFVREGKFSKGGKIDAGKKKKFDKKQEKIADKTAASIAQSVGKDMLASFSFFKDAVTSVTNKIETVVVGVTTRHRDQQYVNLNSSLMSSVKQAETVKAAHAKGTMTFEDAKRQAELIEERTKSITSGTFGPVQRFTEAASLESSNAADAVYETIRQPTISGFEERLMQTSRKAQDILDNKRTGLLGRGPVATPKPGDQAEYVKFGQQLRDKLTKGPGAGGLTTAELDQKATESLEVELEDTSIKSVFSKLAKLGVPSPDKAGTLGASKSLTAYVKIPLPPPGVLQLEFQVSGTRYPDGNNWVQARVMIKGGVDVGAGGFQVKALAGLGFYLEAGSKDYEKLGVLLSFALYRRFVESALVPIGLSDFLWGREAKEGVNAGKYEKKDEARHRYASQWSKMVEEGFEDDEYAESGGIVRGEVTAQAKGMAGGQMLGVGGGAEWQMGKRYDKKSMAAQRQKHADKETAGKYKKGDKDMTGLGKQERELGVTSHRFTFNANAAVGPFSAGFQAIYYGHEKEWWIDGTIAAGGGSFAGDPAAIAARVATWAGDLVVAGGKIVAQGDDARRQGKGVGYKDVRAHGKVLKLGTEAGGTMADLVKGTWGESHQAWITAANQAPMKRGFAESGKAWNDAGANHDGTGLVQGGDPLGVTNGLVNSGANRTAGKLASQGQSFMTTTLGLEKSKSVKLLLRGIVRPGEDRQNEFQFHVLHEKSNDISLFDFIGVKMSAETPIFYAQLPSKKTIWMGGISIDQVKRAGRHEKEVAKKGAKHAGHLI